MVMFRFLVAHKARNERHIMCSSFFIFPWWNCARGMLHDVQCWAWAILNRIFSRHILIRARAESVRHASNNGEIAMKHSSLSCLAAALFALCLAGCATESHRSLAVEQTQSARTAYSGVRSPIAVGKFDNRSSFMRGLFSDGVDRLGSQAKTILITHLQQTNRFTVLDRDNMEEAKLEAEIRKEAQELKGAAYVITGDVSEFGRKEVGDHQLFGILGRGKKQVAYAKVSLNIVDIRTTEVVYSVQGAGEYALSSREIIGFGGTSGYDSTLNGKVLDLAIREAVDRLTGAIDSGAWKPVSK
jgi:curli biogenesis system outer membrane secretion channel CsgG